MDWRQQAETLYTEAGFDPAEPVPASKLVGALIGPRSLRLLDPKAARAEVSVARIGTGWRIYLKRGLPVARAELATLRGLAEWTLMQQGISGEELSRAAAELAEALFEMAGGAQGVRKAKTRKGRRRSRAG